MVLKRLGIDNTINHIKVKVYNADEKEFIGEYPTIADASRATGVNPRNIKRLIQSKGRNTRNTMGITLAFR